MKASVAPHTQASRRYIKPRGRRLTIALLNSRLDRGFHRAAWLSVADAARERDLNIICFDGGVLRSPDGFAAQANVVYDLVNACLINGLIIWSSALDWFLKPKEMEEFCERYRPLPMVSVARVLKGIPSIVVDNYRGMKEAIIHLIHVHGYRRIVFLRGPEGNREERLRYQAYHDTLTESGIPFDPNLVSSYTNWERADGTAAVRWLMDERGLLPGVDFEAVVSVGDDMACGAMEALQARGIRVPGDVAIVGFNDDEEGRAIVPSLTTVRQPVEALGRQAVENLLALLCGDQIPQQISMPLELILCQSCGCLSPVVTQAATGRATPVSRPGARTLREALDAEREDIIADVSQAIVAQVSRLDAHWADRLLDALSSEFQAEPENGSANVFLIALNDVLRQVVAWGGDVEAWQGMLSALRRRTSPYLTNPATWSCAEDLWQQARVTIGETAAHVREYQRFQTEQFARMLGEVSQEIQTASDWKDLKGKIVRELPRLGILSCYLALYEDPRSPADWSRLVLVYNENGCLELEEDGRRFPSYQLAPEGMLPKERRFNLVVMPLYFRERQLGFALLEMESRGLAICETLREQLSSAVEGVRLRAEIQHAWQRAEEANRLKSCFLATVSHELRTPLSLIVGTIEMMLRQRTQTRAWMSESSWRDLESIQAGAQHLARLIGDVLDLANSQAGELRLARRPQDLKEILYEVNLLAGPMAREKGLAWRVEIPQCLPFVWGDRTRLQQVVLNLVNNAIKFTEQGGVTLRVKTGKRTVTVTVSDTGLGIPAHELETIFDEFRQSGRTAQRGYGGMGLGLAISRRLIELHGGQIGVCSSGEEGAGSTFYFTLPTIEKVADGEEEAKQPGQTVLLLIGRVGGGERLREHLVQRGFQVEELAVENNPGWLEHIVASPPGAVVLDFAPVAEIGWELMRRLKENPATQDVPVVFYSLSNERDSGAMLAMDYLSKPVGSAELLRALERQGLQPNDCRDGQIILIVDDEPNILDLHARIVQSYVPGCRVLKAGDGREALEIMQRQRPDLVLLDLMMPEVDGFAILEAMRSRELTRDVPVIVLTAQILTCSDIARLQQGVAAVLAKGLFSTAEVLAQVEATLARHKGLGNEAQRIMRQVMAYMHEHYADFITRQDLAHRFGLSERHLNRCFHEETGMALMTYLNRYRVKQARVLLEKGNQSVTDVAFAVGFSDSNYFGRVFRKEVGLSPRAYRRGERPSPG